MHHVIQATVHCYCCTPCPAVCVSVRPAQDGSELPLKEVATGENVHSLLCILDTLIVRRHCAALLLLHTVLYIKRHMALAAYANAWRDNVCVSSFIHVLVIPENNE